MPTLKNSFTSDKICIIVFGNIASGKSSFARTLAQELEGFEYICFDQVRIDIYLENYLKGSIEREEMAKKRCRNLLLNNKLIVFETLAISDYYNRMLPELKQNFNKLIFVKVDCSAFTCKRRYFKRNMDGYFCIAPPFNHKLSIDEYIDQTEREQKKLIYDIVLNSENLTTKQMIAVFKNIFC
jgi:deoxyadenosine/deoxycytidine kinase